MYRPNQVSSWFAGILHLYLYYFFLRGTIGGPRSLKAEQIFNTRLHSLAEFVNGEERKNYAL